MITVQLTLEQSKFVEAAIRAEVAKGQSTFLTEEMVLSLNDVVNDIITARNTSKESIMARVEREVEDYCDACDYTNYRQLTAEDIDYLAGELQIGTVELRDLLNLELV